MKKRVYKKLGISDLRLVVSMEKYFRSAFICEENARLFLSKPQNWLFACIEKSDGDVSNENDAADDKGGKIIGFAYGYELNRLDSQGDMLYIHEVGVLPEYHRQGIGAELMRNIKSACKLLGICKFFLFMQKSNEAAMGLYLKAGGKPAVDFEHGDGNVVFFFKDF